MVCRHDLLLDKNQTNTDLSVQVMWEELILPCWHSAPLCPRPSNSCQPFLITRLNVEEMYQNAMIMLKKHKLGALFWISTIDAARSVLSTNDVILNSSCRDIGEGASYVRAAQHHWPNKPPILGVEKEKNSKRKLKTIKGCSLKEHWYLRTRSNSRGKTVPFLARKG
uniref:Uncharacterized protein n=1 Tax=Cucumis melo TaxID=3656 RepID=A0A9I9EEP5_CUCME